MELVRKHQGIDVTVEQRVWWSQGVIAYRYEIITRPRVATHVSSRMTYGASSIHTQVMNWSGNLPTADGYAKALAASQEMVEWMLECDANYDANGNLRAA